MNQVIYDWIYDEYLIINEGRVRYRYHDKDVAYRMCRNLNRKEEEQDDRSDNN